MAEMIILAKVNLLSAITLTLVQSKNVSFGKELTLYQNDELLDWSKLKAFAEDKIIVIKSFNPFPNGKIFKAFADDKIDV